jgi:hypothetical protein
MMSRSGAPDTATGVASLYADFCDAFVVDASDAGEASAIGELGYRVLTADTLALASNERVDLASAALSFARAAAALCESAH